MSNFLIGIICILLHWWKKLTLGAKCKGKTLLVIEIVFTLHRYCTVSVQFWFSVSKAKHDRAALLNGCNIQISLVTTTRSWLDWTLHIANLDSCCFHELFRQRVFVSLQFTIAQKREKIQNRNIPEGWIEAARGREQVVVAIAARMDPVVAVAATASVVIQVKVEAVGSDFVRRPRATRLTSLSWKKNVQVF